MVNCADFLREYSNYRDGLVDTTSRAAIETHLSICSDCARYDRVVSAGVVQLRALPQVEPSSDFLPRLQHSIYHLQDERAWWARRDTSATSVGFVILLVFLIGTAAWIPTIGQSVPVVELPPVAAAAPPEVEQIHTLFREGPLLETVQPIAPLSFRRTNTVFFRYTRLGGSAYQTVAAPPR
jgi:hypothetical protein